MSKIYDIEKSLNDAGIEAQMGVMYYMLGNYSDSYNIFKSSIVKLQYVNQMGLACVQKYICYKWSCRFVWRS
jgi:hypothetical protein